MVVLRLQRMGRKKEPHFRLIAQEKAKDPWDKSLEILGFVNPRTKEKRIKKERIEDWLSKGAQPTNTVYNLLIDEGIIKDEKRKTLNIKKKKEKEDKEEGTEDGGKEEKKEPEQKEEKETPGSAESAGEKAQKPDKEGGEVKNEQKEEGKKQEETVSSKEKEAKPGAEKGGDNSQAETETKAEAGTETKTA